MSWWVTDDGTVVDLDGTGPVEDEDEPSETDTAPGGGKPPPTRRFGSIEVDSGARDRAAQWHASHDQQQPGKQEEGKRRVIVDKPQEFRHAPSPPLWSTTVRRGSLLGKGQIGPDREPPLVR